MYLNVTLCGHCLFCYVTVVIQLHILRAHASYLTTWMENCGGPPIGLVLHSCFTTQVKEYDSLPIEPVLQRFSEC